MMTTKMRELLLLYNMSSATIEFLYITGQRFQLHAICVELIKTCVIKINGNSIMNSV